MDSSVIINQSNVLLCVNDSIPCSWFTCYTLRSFFVGFDTNVAYSAE